MGRHLLSAGTHPCSTIADLSFGSIIPRIGAEKVSWDVKKKIKRWRRMLTFLKMAVIGLRCRTECGKQDMDQGVTSTSLTAGLSAVKKSDGTFDGTFEK